MLEIHIIMNTAMEEIYSKKCCGYHDLNLEIQVANRGDSTVVVPSRCRLEGPGGPLAVDYLMPHGDHRLGPGEHMSFYCYMDENRFALFDALVMTDGDGAEHRASIKP